MGTLSNISFPQIKKTSHINKCTCTYDRKKKKTSKKDYHFTGSDMCWQGWC